MRQPTPAQLTSPGSTIGATRKPSIDEGADHAVGGASRLEGGEHVGDSRGNLLIRIDDGAAISIAHIADRQRRAQLTAFGGSAFGTLQAASQNMEFRFLCRPQDYADLVSAEAPLGDGCQRYEVGIILTGMDHQLLRSR
jgi:hypothetical protein